jgi:hypothetical protein
VWSWVGWGPDDTPPLDDVAPPLAQVHLLGRGSGPLGFRGNRVPRDGALRALLGRPLCKGRPRILLKAAPVVRRVVPPAATALRLFPRGDATAREMGATTSDAPGSVSAVTLRVAEALAALALQWVLGDHVRFHRHSQAAVFCERSHLGEMK